MLNNPGKKCHKYKRHFKALFYCLYIAFFKISSQFFFVEVLKILQNARQLQAFLNLWTVMYTIQKSEKSETFLKKWEQSEKGESLLCLYNYI